MSETTRLMHRELMLVCLCIKLVSKTWEKLFLESFLGKFLLLIIIEILIAGPDGSSITNCDLRFFCIYLRADAVQFSARISD